MAAVEPDAPPQVILDPGALVGLWKGTANGRPLELRIASITGGTIVGELTFYLGPTPRTVPADGSLDSSTGKVQIRGGDFQLRGVAGGLSMAGTYSTGRKTLPWTLAKGN